MFFRFISSPVFFSLSSVLCSPNLLFLCLMSPISFLTSSVPCLTCFVPCLPSMSPVSHALSPVSPLCPLSHMLCPLSPLYVPCLTCFVPCLPSMSPVSRPQSLASLFLSIVSSPLYRISCLFFFVSHPLSLAPSSVPYLSSF